VAYAADVVHNRFKNGQDSNLLKYLNYLPECYKGAGDKFLILLDCSVELKVAEANSHCIKSERLQFDGMFSSI